MPSQSSPAIRKHHPIHRTRPSTLTKLPQRKSQAVNKSFLQVLRKIAHPPQPSPTNGPLPRCTTCTYCSDSSVCTSGCRCAASRISVNARTAMPTEGSTEEGRWWGSKRTTGKLEGGGCGGVVVQEEGVWGVKDKVRV